MTHILVNPKANNGRGEDQAREWAREKSIENANFVSVLDIADMKGFFEGLVPEDTVILTGGDGTLNHFANDLDGYVPKNEIYYVRSGSGNDFFRDAEADCVDGRISLNRYLCDLPVVTVNGVRRRFLNGIGYGIDGETCRIGDIQRANSTKKVNYTTIAIKLCLGAYKKHKATVTVDGVTRRYKNVWFASTMKGRYYGGGMMVAPNQDRFNENRTVSVVCLYKRSRLVTLMRFSSIFTGEHLKYNWVTVTEGKSVKVEFKKPCALQIDGEVIPDVTSYTVEI